MPSSVSGKSGGNSPRFTSGTNVTSTGASSDTQTPIAGHIARSYLRGKSYAPSRATLSPMFRNSGSFFWLKIDSRVSVGDTLLYVGGRPGSTP